MVIFIISRDFCPFFVHNFIKHFIHNLAITMWVYFLEESEWISLSKKFWKWLVNAWVAIGQHLVNTFIHTYDTSKFREYSNISDAWKDVLKYMLFRVKIISQIDFTSFPHAPCIPYRRYFNESWSYVTVFDSILARH